MIALLVKAGLVTSNGEARRAISQNGVAVNDAKVTDVFAKFTKDDITGEDFIVRRGKKNFRKIVVE